MATRRDSLRNGLGHLQAMRINLAEDYKRRGLIDDYKRHAYLYCCTYARMYSTEDVQEARAMYPNHGA